jgi:hypothetical protein
MRFIYWLINVFIWFVINSNIIHEKCKILRSNIAIFRVMGPRNLMDEYRGFSSGHTTFIIRKAVKIDPDSPSRTFKTLYQANGCPNPDRIMNPHHSGHLKSCTKECKIQLKCRWKCHIVKLKYRISSMLLEIVDNLFHILSLKTTCLTEGRRNTGSQITSTGCFQQMLSSKHTSPPCSAINVVL